MSFSEPYTCGSCGAVFQHGRALYAHYDSCPNLLHAPDLRPTPLTVEKAPDHDPVNHPRHYTGHPSGVECIQITEHMNFCLGNAMKYLWRASQKNGVEDLEKARWYIGREIARLRGPHG